MKYFFIEINKGIIILSYSQDYSQMGDQNIYIDNLHKGQL